MDQATQSLETGPRFNCDEGRAHFPVPTLSAEVWAADGPINAVDTHAHVFVRDLPHSPVARYTPTHDATIDTYVCHLTACGVSHAVLVQPSFLGTDNRFFVDVLKRYPSRFRGVAVVDLDSTARELEQLAAAGVVGIRLNLVGLSIPDFGLVAWRRLLSQINAFGWHVEVHRQARDLPAIVGPLLDQSCRVVVDHFGRPAPNLGVNDPGFRYLLSVADSGRVWVKLSAAYRNVTNGDGVLFGKTAAAVLLDAFSAERLLWGSDWPHTQHCDHVNFAAARAALDAWIENSRDQRIILCETAVSLFQFDDERQII